VSRCGHEALASALPLESIELQAALAAACAAAGDATQAQALRAAAGTRAQALAATLDGGALRERFVARHRALIGD
jgi:hypothetical protein